MLLSFSPFRTGFALLAMTFFFTGCVPLSKYNELQSKNMSLITESEALKEKNVYLSQENDSLKKSGDALRIEITNLRKAAVYNYQKGIEYFASKDYPSALESFETVIDRFPTDPAAKPAYQKMTEIYSISAENYHKIIRSVEGIKDLRGRIETLDHELAEIFLTKEDTDKLLHKRELYSTELSSFEEMNKHIIIEDDPTQLVRYYRSTRSVYQEIGLEKSFYVELYIAQQYSGKKKYRLRTRYVGDNWISYDSIHLKGENGNQVDVICKYPEKLSKMNDDRIYEWSDNDLDEEKVNKLLKSTSISVRFSGGYRYSFQLSDEQITAFREIAKKFSTLK